MSGKRLNNALFVVAVISVSSPALANHPAPIGVAFDYAIVDDVKTFRRIVNVPVSREECWEEPVTIYQPPPPPPIRIPLQSSAASLAPSSAINSGVVAVKIGRPWQELRLALRSAMTITVGGSTRRLGAIRRPNSVAALLMIIDKRSGLTDIW